MSVEKIIVSLIAALFQSIAASIILFKQINCFNKKDKIKLFTIMWIYCVLTFLFVPNYLRFVLFTIVIIFVLYFIFEIKDKIVVLYAFDSQIILAISEVVISLILLMFGANTLSISNNYFIELLLNLAISVFAIIIAIIPITSKFLNLLKTLFTKNKKLINYLIIFLIMIYIIILKNGLEFLLKSNYYMNVLFIIGVAVIVYIFVKNEFKYDQIKDEYKNMLNHVTKYEKIITDQGKANHEFKNQLMVIRGYAQMNSPKLIEYLDSVIEDSKKTHSSYLISQLNKFPAGGIKGLLYYKLSTMDDENIKHELNVESGVKIRLDTLGTESYKNITKVLGVLFDNAIDACKKSKDKKIIIDVVKKTNLVTFSIYNTYKGKIDIDQIGTGFTTKGSGHGYGLRLVKDIIESSNIFEIENALEDEYYVTKLTIKTKKKQTKKKK